MLISSLTSVYLFNIQFKFFLRPITIEPAHLCEQLLLLHIYLPVLHIKVNKLIVFFFKKSSMMQKYGEEFDQV